MLPPEAGQVLRDLPRELGAGMVNENGRRTTCQNSENRYPCSVIVSATELANDSKAVLDRVARSGETVEIQRHGKTVAQIRRQAGASRDELVRLLRGRGFSEADSRELKQAMDAASEVFGDAGRD